MAKLNQEATVKLVDTESNEEISYKTTTEPKKSTWGNSYFGTLNSRGIAKIQAMGHKLNSEDDYCDLLRRTFGLTENELGDRGPKWDTTEARQRYKVYVDEQEFSPEFTAKQIAREQSIIHSAPKVPLAQTDTASTNVPAVPQPPKVEVPKPVADVPMPPVQAVADTVQIAVPMPPAAKVEVPAMPQPQAQAPQLTPIEQGYVNLMKDYLGQNKFSKEQLISSLGSKVGNERAAQLYELAAL